MANLTVKGVTYKYPDPGREPGWGEDATEWAKAVTDALATAVAAGDIKGVATLNATTSPTNIPGMVINATESVSAVVLYHLEKTTPALRQSGKLTICKDGTNWVIQNEYIGESTGVVFSITNTGQIRYELASGTVQLKFRFITVEV